MAHNNSLNIQSIIRNFGLSVVFGTDTDLGQVASQSTGTSVAVQFNGKRSNV